MDIGKIRKLVAEAVGTFVLVAMGCGAAVALGCNGAVGDAAYVGTALAFGLAVVAMAYAVGPISGCHLNPAISLACAIDKRMSWEDCGMYVIAQCIGAFCGCVPMLVMEGAGCGFGANALFAGAADPMVASIFIEAVLTFVFVLVVLGTTDGENGDGKRAGLVIGLSLTLVHLVGIHYTGTSVNPARSLAPAVLAGGNALAALPAFIVGPLVGGALAAVAYRLIAGGPLATGKVESTDDGEAEEQSA